MSDNTNDIDTTPVDAAPVVEVKEEPKAEVKSAPVADATTDYWATAWANRGV
jgi:hypothetical protein